MGPVVTVMVAAEELQKEQPKYPRFIEIFNNIARVKRIIEKTSQGAKVVLELAVETGKKELNYFNDVRPGTS